MKRMDLFLKNSVYLCFFLCCALKSQADIGRNLAYPSPDVEIDAVEVAKQVYFANHFHAFDNFSIKRRGSTLSVLVNKSANGSPITTAV
ncbi:MAG: hypothetical protein AB2758_19100 [Candidatus Thiodiazotropha endolucinida]